MSVHKGKHRTGVLPTRIRVLRAMSLLSKANELVGDLVLYGGRLHGNRTVDELMRFYFGDKYVST